MSSLSLAEPFQVILSGFVLKGGIDSIVARFLIYVYSQRRTSPIPGSNNSIL